MIKLIQKKRMFKIYIVILIIFLTLPFYIYVNQNSNSFECSVEKNITFQEYEVRKANIQYESISIFPEYKNILCIGKIINIESNNNTVIIKRAYSDQLFSYGLDLILGLLFVSSFFREFFKKNYINFQIFQFVYFLIYINFILNSFGFYAYNIPKYDPGYIVFFIFVLNLKTNKDDIIGLLSQFIFFSLFGTKFFGLIAVILLIFNKSILSNFMRYKIFVVLPIVKFSLIFISSIFEKLNILWLSLIENPHSGYTRFYDLQWNLVSLICEKNPEYSTKTNFGGERFCPSELYSPLYQYISFKFNLYFGYLLVMGLLLFVLSLIYFKILKDGDFKSYALLLFLLSPTLNYQIYQGNLDFLTFVVFSSFIIYRIPYLLKLLVIAFVGLLELHPLPFLLGLATYNIFKKNYKKLSLNILFILFSAAIIWTDNSIISVKNWNSSIGFSYIYHPEISFGLSTDHIFFLGNKIDPLILYPTFLLVYLFLILIFRNKVFIKDFPNKFITNEEFLGYTAWFALIILYENFSYRLAVFSFILFFIYLENKTTLKNVIIVAFFLTPTSLVEFEIFKIALMIVNKISLYVLAFFIFHKAFQIIFVKTKNLKLEDISN